MKMSPPLLYGFSIFFCLRSATLSLHVNDYACFLSKKDSLLFESSTFLLNFAPNYNTF
jgi:hypothetical protein